MLGVMVLVVSASVLALTWTLSKSRIVNTCGDLDGGLDGYTASYVKYKTSAFSPYNTTYDHCGGAGYLNEYTCANIMGVNYYLRYYTECPNGCSAGRCNP